MNKYPVFLAAFVYIQCVSIASGVVWHYDFRPVATINLRPIILALIVGEILSMWIILASISNVYDQPESERDATVVLVGASMVAVGIITTVLLIT